MATETSVERIQRALDNRVHIYAQKMEKADPFADDDCNRQERYAFALECFDYFAIEAGLRSPVDAPSKGPVITFDYITADNSQFWVIRIGPLSFAIAWAPKPWSFRASVWRPALPEDRG